MSESFVRYYVQNIRYSYYNEFRNSKLPQLDEFVFIDPRTFEYQKSFGYVQAPRIEEAVKFIKQECVFIVEHRDPENAPCSSIYASQQSNMFEDVLVLLCLATGENVLPVLKEYCVGGSFTTSVIEVALKDTITGSLSHIIDRYSLGDFLTRGLDSLQEKDLSRLGFRPAIFWYLQSLRTHGHAPTIFEVSLYWAVLEVIAKTLDYEGNKCRMVSEMLKNFGLIGPAWRFLLTAIKDWYSIRNLTFHEGKEPKWYPADESRLAGRLNQIKELSCVLLANMLVPQSPEWMTQTAERITSYYP